MYEELLSLIRAKCQRESWHGPDDFKKGGAAFASNISFRNGFAFPPATPEQLRETEDFLGFPLPLLLRVLYTQLANGGFGPGAGIRGTVGGYGNPSTFANGNDETIVKFHRRRKELVDLSHHAQRWQQAGQKLRINLQYSVFPAQLFPVCDLGDQVEVCLDQNGHLFLWGPSERDFVFALSSRRMSLEDWLWSWLEGKHLIQGYDVGSSMST